MKGILRFGFLVMLFMLLACGSMRITSSWKGSQTQPRKFNKILVLGLIQEADRSLHEKMEQHVVGDLLEAGYPAVCACDVFGPKSFENSNEKDALARLRGAGVDAVLTVVLLNKTRERYYVPGRVYYTPYVVYHRRFWGYYNAIYGRVYAPGYYETNTRYFWESNLYDLSGDEELLYSAQTQCFDPASTDAQAHEYGRLIVSDLLKQGVMQK